MRRDVQVHLLQRQRARLLISDDVPVRGAPEHIHTFREPHVGLEEHKVVTFLHEPERGLELGPLHDLHERVRHALHPAGRLDAARL